MLVRDPMFPSHLFWMPNNLWCMWAYRPGPVIREEILAEVCHFFICLHLQFVLTSDSTQWCWGRRVEGVNGGGWQTERMTTNGAVGYLFATVAWSGYFFWIVACAAFLVRNDEMRVVTARLHLRSRRLDLPSIHNS